MSKPNKPHCGQVYWVSQLIDCYNDNAKLIYKDAIVSSFLSNVIEVLCLEGGAGVPSIILKFLGFLGSSIQELIKAT